MQQQQNTEQRIVKMTKMTQKVKNRFWSLVRVKVRLSSLSSLRSLYSFRALLAGLVHFLYINVGCVDVL